MKRFAVLATIAICIGAAAFAQVDPSKTKDAWIGKGLTASCVTNPTGMLVGKLSTGKNPRADDGRFFILDIAPCVESVKKCAVVFEMPSGAEKAEPAFGAAANGGTVQLEWRGIDPVWDPGQGRYMPDLGNPRIRVPKGGSFVCLPIGWPVIYDNSDDADT